MDETQNNQADQENQNQNGSSLPAELEDIKAQLAAERAAIAEKDACITERDAKIAELQASLSEAKVASEAKDAQLQTTAAELATAVGARDTIVSNYLALAKTANPTIPEAVIKGDTIEEIDASIESAKGIVEAVKTAMAAEAANTKVPAGSPPRSGISTDGMTAREKIAYAVQQKSSS